MKWLKDDGSLDLNALDALAADVKTVTDSNRAIDSVIKAEKLGAPKAVAFRCSHSGMFLPSDWIRLWGMDYGIGLGEQPVSESLNTLYHVAATKTDSAKTVRDLMHPVCSSRAQVDFGVYPTEDIDASSLVLHKDDPGMTKRAEIIYQKQLGNPGSRLRMLLAQYNLANNKGTK